MIAVSVDHSNVLLAISNILHILSGVLNLFVPCVAKLVFILFCLEYGFVLFSLLSNSCKNNTAVSHDNYLLNHFQNYYYYTYFYLDLLLVIVLHYYIHSFLLYILIDLSHLLSLFLLNLHLYPLLHIFLYNILYLLLLLF